LLTNVLDTLLVLVCVVAIVTDARHHRIPNWLTFPAIGAGLLLNGLRGWEFLLHSVAGLFFALAFMLPFFALDLLKAGDVKLVVAWGTIKGVGQPVWQSFVLWAFLYGALLGGVMSLLFLRKAGVRANFKEHLKALCGVMLSRTKPLPSPDWERVPMPYGVALGLGALIALLLERWFGQACPLIRL